jgi:hypothetical protein
MSELDRPDDLKWFYEPLRELSEPDFELTDWLEDVSENRRRNLEQNRPFYSEAKQIDHVSQRFLKVTNSVYLSDIYDPSLALFCRSHSAFLTSVMLSLNGQLAEAHMVMRGCIEASLYAVLIRRKPHLRSIWIERERSSEAKAAARREFTVRSAFEVLNTDRPTILSHVRKLYDHTITNGAHPNIGALATSLGLVQGEYGPRFAHYYLGGMHTPLFPVCLATVLLVGWAALDISTCIYHDEFSELGLMVEIQDSHWQERMVIPPTD